MKNIIFCTFVIFVFNGCAQYSALVAPSYTLADSGNIINAAINFGSGKYIEKETGKNAYQHLSSAIEKKDNTKKFSSQMVQLIEKKFNETRMKKLKQDLNKQAEKNFYKDRKKLIKNN